MSTTKVTRIQTVKTENITEWISLYDIANNKMERNGGCQFDVKCLKDIHW